MDNLKRLNKIINKKNAGEALTKIDIKFAVMGYVDGIFSDEEITPFIRAIYEKGMNAQETFDLTRVYQHSGETLNFRNMGVRGVIADKHSTGGVGDTTTLVMVPLLASLGVNMIKMSGGTLGHTGGTSNKICAFARLKNQLSTEKALEIVKKHKGVFLTQSQTLVPADKKIYDLRNKTGLVDSIPLIASSVASKKLALSPDIILIDVKCGAGALMKTREDAISLGELIKNILTRARKKAIVVVTPMDDPLGDCIGEELELREAIDILKGNVKNRLSEVSFILSSLILQQALNISEQEANAKIEYAITKGRALYKFMDIVRAQEGSPMLFVDDIKYKEIKITAEKTGFVDINTEKLGALCNAFTEKFRDFKGVKLIATPNSKIENGEVIFKIFLRKKPFVVEHSSWDIKEKLTNSDIEMITKEISSCFNIVQKSSKKPFKAIEAIL